jgi:hemolysin III
MKKRIKLRDRLLPDYTNGEEVMNMVTHIVGGGFGILALVLCLVRSSIPRSTVGAAIYGGSMIAIYAMSSIYHGLHPSTGKKVLQILDHCTIYLLIAGSYSAIALGVLFEHFPILAMAVLAAQWGLAALAITLTAIDLEKYNVFSMVCYIGMGWMALLFVPQLTAALTAKGFYWLLAGGIAYTVGAVLYGLGSKKKWLHSVFHIFVVLGSFLQFIAIYFFAII